MLTFLEFYQTLLGFVNFKLYTDVNLVYPPKLDISKDEGAAGLGALIIEATNSLADLSNTSHDNENKKDTKEEVKFCLSRDFFYKKVYYKCTLLGS
jgi:pescadillo protein